MASPHYTACPRSRLHRDQASHRTRRPSRGPSWPGGCRDWGTPQGAPQGPGSGMPADRVLGCCRVGSPLKPRPLRAHQTSTPPPPPHPPPTGHSLSDELNGVFILHPALDEGQCHEDRSPGDRQQGPPSLCTPTPPSRPPAKDTGPVPSPSPEGTQTPRALPSPVEAAGSALSPTTWCQIWSPPSLAV